MAITKEEYARKQRRRARQLLGLLVATLAMLGALTVVNLAVGAVRNLFDDTAERAVFEQKVEGFVLFDPLPFSGGIQNCNEQNLRSTAVWGTLYSILETPNGLTNYELDAETQQVLLPAVEVDAYLATVVGPDFKLQHKSFEMEGMLMEYDEARQCYLIPATGTVGTYEAKVTGLFIKAGQLRVTTGYIPSYNSSDLTTVNTTEPVKYMDYLFEKSGDEWYLVGIAESETKPQATPAPTNAVNNPPVVANSSLQQAILDEAGAPSAPPASSAVQE
ncbi:MAG: Ice-structuring protein [Faecalibacterium sp.]|nr:Ice-structuring protein [Faecalibacterium sp.]